MKYLERLLTTVILEHLKEDKVLAITGARQTGKTTLVRKVFLEGKDRHNYIYYNLDIPDTRDYLRKNARNEFTRESDKVIILDEIQKEPVLFEIVKVLVDERPEKRGRFILLGSSQILLLKKIRESLAGRIGILELYPFTLSEIFGTKPGIPVLFETILNNFKKGQPFGDIPILSYPEAEPRIMKRDEMYYMGGLPEVYQRGSTEARINWFRDYRRTYLERDLLELARVHDLVNFSNCHRMLAARCGNLVNYSEIARDISMATNTIRQYTRYLEISYQLFLLQPYYRNIGKRLVKSPKVYFLDTGILRSFLENFNTMNGWIYENWVIAEIFKLLKTLKPEFRLYFYRTIAGLEVDLLIEYQDRLLPVEIKYHNKILKKDTTNLRRGMKDFGTRCRNGVIIYPGSTVENIGANILAIPDYQLLT